MALTDPGIIAIRIRRGDALFHVHGQKAGAEGVWLAQGQVEGIYDAPIKSTWKTGAFQIGSSQRAIKRLHRDMELGFHVTETITDAFEWNESLFRQIFFYEEDQWSLNPKKTTIEVQTALSGTRKLDVLMYEQPDFRANVDPLMQQYGNLVLKLRAGQPMWYEDDVWSTFTSGATSASGTVTVSNPTDQVMWHKWILTPAIWTLPDFEWTGDPGERSPGSTNAARYITDIKVTTANGGAVIDLDRAELMYRDLNGTNIIAQMGGNRIFTFPVPPYTPAFQLPVSYKGAPAGGATVSLVQPRKWSRPYGLEAVSILNTASPKDYMFRFSYPGSFEYRIPDWCERLDLVCVGGGGGGEGGGLLVSGAGGSASSWAYKTIVRGVDIPWTTSYLKGAVGAGGYPGRGLQAPSFPLLDWNYVINPSQPFTTLPQWVNADGLGGKDGGKGGDSYIVATGMTTLTSTGGAGGKNRATVKGQALADLTFNGKTYQGAQEEIQPGNAGNHPGGGGAGGWPLIGRGGIGGDGQIWIRAYGWAGS